MHKHKIKQIIVVSLTVVLVGVLMAQPIKGLIKKQEAEHTAQEQAGQPLVDLAAVSQVAKQGLNASLSKQISDLEDKLQDAKGEERLSLLRQLAGKWDDVNQNAPLGFVYEDIAKEEPSYSNWLKAGDAFSEAYSNIQDTTVASVLNRHALEAYQAALALDENSLDAKTGVGSAMVNGGGAPMAGIALLREVVGKDPKNLKANMQLGIFSMTSRQFDRAVDRFKTVIAIEPSPEAYFYLASSYENIGMKKDAIAAYEKSKELAADPSLSQFVDRKIEELSK
ncbi:tetratricopeptide repeat protein [Olivibacter sitiensis]|uniref:tetratricopeptide repeat protein n=1 Tax=Olivibacter sitiensis TaxID=376470 RepID=UPI00055B5E66|nr:tetratricopeptide repeat protein [Olivibacter sitiensis]